MGKGALWTVLELRRAEERRARLTLARCREQADLARSFLAPPPAEAPCPRGLPAEDFLARRAWSHLAWAVFGARLGRSQAADAEEAAASASWAAAAADLRSTERLVARRAQQARSAAARRAQRQMDEVAIVRWGRQARP